PRQPNATLARAARLLERGEHRQQRKRQHERKRRAIERQAANLAVHRVIQQGSDRKPESRTELLFHCSSSLEPTSPCYARLAAAEPDADIIPPLSPGVPPRWWRCRSSSSASSPRTLALPRLHRPRARRSARAA